MRMTSQTRPLWRAGLLGLAIAIFEITALTFGALALDGFGRSPSGYAGAAWGQALLYFFLIALGASSVTGIIAGGTLYRRKRGFLLEWSLMLGCLAVFVVSPLLGFIYYISKV